MESNGGAAADGQPQRLNSGERMTNDRVSTVRSGQGPRPYWLIGSALLGVVLLLLAAAFLLDRQFRPRVGIESAPAAGSTATGNQATAPGASAVASVAVPWQRIGTTPLEREIEEAYARYWEVRSQAYLTLDTSRLSEVMAGEELRREEKQVRDLQAQGRAGKLDYEFHPTFRTVSADQAVIYDEHINRSLHMDPVTRQVFPTAQAPELEKVSYEFRKIEGKWKVVDGAIHD
jgi:hypothetical protein